MIEIRDRIKELRRVRASELVPHSQNWRGHPANQRQALQAVLSQVGYADALLVRELPDGRLGLVDGHLRAETTPDMEVPVLVLDVDEQEAAMLLATLDPLAGLAEANTEALQALLSGLEITDQALQQMLEPIMGDGFGWGANDPPEDPGPEIDRAEELREKWGVERGQVWQVGRHRVMCGDATSAEDVERLLQGLVPHLLLADPPYGNRTEYAGYEDTVANLEMVVGGVVPLLERVGCALITPGVANVHRWPVPQWILSWAEAASLGPGPWGFCCWQPVLAYGPDPYLARGLGRRPDIYHGTSEGHSSDDHPVAKPMKVWRWLVERGSPAEGEEVLDPFVGSGTTLVVCEQLGRIGYGMDISPGYIAVTLERLSGMGLEPMRIDS